LTKLACFILYQSLFGPRFLLLSGILLQKLYLLLGLLLPGATHTGLLHEYIPSLAQNILVELPPLLLLICVLLKRVDLLIISKVFKLVLFMSDHVFLIAI
jgi:hypothetical protein